MARRAKSKAAVLRIAPESDYAFPDHFDEDARDLFRGLAGEVKALRQVVTRSDLAAVANIVEIDQDQRQLRAMAREALAAKERVEYSRLVNAATRQSRAFSAGLSSLGLTSYDRNKSARVDAAAKQANSRPSIWGDRLTRKMKPQTT